MKEKSSTDIYFSSALLSLGAVLDSIDKTDPRHMTFTFVAPTLTQTGTLSEIPQMDLDDIESQWLNRTLVVNAFDFSEAIKRMKSAVHSS